MSKRRVKRIRLNKNVLTKRIIALTMFLMITVFVSNSVVAQNSQPDYKMVVVERGQTLWEIAKANIQEGQNIEAAIYEIKEINKKEKADIFPGEKLKIPLNL